MKIRIKALTITARVQLQTLLLANAPTTRRLRERVGAFTKEIEESHQRPGPWREGEVGALRPRDVPGAGSS